MRKTEIGGYFGFGDLVHHEYHEGLIAVNNARNALVYILRAKKIKEIYIPYYLCDSVSEVLKREGCAFRYYHITADFLPVFEEIPADAVLYLVNFFGILSDEQILSVQKQYPKMILDNVHAFFRKPLPGMDTVYSCRKFFGVPDGGYVCTDTVLREELPADESYRRMQHILGRAEGRKASCFYADFKENDAGIKTLELRSMSEITHQLLGALDYERAVRTRNENFAFLREKLQNVNGLRIPDIYGAYAYPFYFKNGMELKKALAADGIFVATLWPNVLSFPEGIETDYTKNILPLPCDQRYSSEDMAYMVQRILENIENK